MPPARTHSENLKCVCLLCMKKSKVMRNITDKLESLISETVLCGYDFNDERLPKVLCSNCYSVLYEYSKGNFTHTIDVYDDYSTIGAVRMLTRGNSSCQCVVCDIARSSTTANFGLSSRLIPKKTFPTTSSDSTTVPKAIKICRVCLSELHRGKQHTCSQRQRHDNLVEMATTNASSSKLDEKVTSTIIRQKLTSNASTTDHRFSCATITGRPITVSSPPAAASARSTVTCISAEKLHDMKIDLNLSTNQSRTLSSHIRSALNSRRAVEPKARDQLQTMSHRVDHHFTCEKQDFLHKVGSKSVLIETDVVYCVGLDSFKDYIISSRQYDGTTELKTTIGMDSGGGFLKLCMTIQPHDQSAASPTSRRKLLSEKMPSLSQDSSVKKLFIIAISPDVDENYRNLLKMWNLLRLTQAQFGFISAMDLKLGNIMFGLMSHSSNHPCTWCDASKKRLHEKGAIRTLGTIRELYWKFQSSGKDISKGKEYGNCVHAPIFKESDDTKVIDMYPPPELHLLLGAVNTLYLGLVSSWPDASTWTDAIHVTREAMHGGSFTGNSCKKLLNNTDILENLAPQECGRYVTVLKSLKDVVDACFGKKLDPNYIELIRQFRDNYLSLQLSVTPKIHAIFFHVEEFCSTHEKGLGCFSEQSFEAAHSLFQTVWMKYKVPNNHHRYGEQLFRAVCEFNSCHL